MSVNHCPDPADTMRTLCGRQMPMLGYVSLSHMLNTIAYEKGERGCDDTWAYWCHRCAEKAARRDRSICEQCTDHGDLAAFDHGRWMVLCPAHLEVETDRWCESGREFVLEVS